MEDWEMELDFHAHNEYEKALRKANGTLNDEEFEGASDDEMQNFLKEAGEKSGDLPQDDWEEIK